MVGKMYDSVNFGVGKKDHLTVWFHVTSCNVSIKPQEKQKSCTDNFGLNISRRISAALLGEHPPTETPVS